MKIFIEEICPKCNGSGKIYFKTVCPECEGTGKIRYTIDNVLSIKIKKPIKFNIKDKIKKE